MNKPCCIIGAVLINAAACASVGAAPLDALLTANQNNIPWASEVEVSYDVLNKSLDFLNAREKNGATTTVGDYKGAHVRGGIAITPQLWVDGALWQREIDYRSFLAKLNTWQLAGQYKVIEGRGAMPSVAVRLGAWGNYADSLTKFTNTTVAGTKFTSATVTKPKDTQYQLDLIGTWPVSQRTDVSIFAGAGVSRVTFDTVSATSRKDGCEYNVAFSRTEVVSTLAQPCNAAVVVTRFAQPTSASVDVNKEAKYTASYYQAGFMAAWHTDDWRVRGGYQYQTINRSEVDGIIDARGDTPYKHNHVLIGDVSYKAFKNTIVFLRGQYMLNQFNGEVPLSYNSLTADRFNQRYGIVSTGLIFTF